MNSQVLIIDFGSQLTKLIARRIREMSIYCEIIPYTSLTKTLITNKKPKCLIFSGGPASVNEENSPKLGKFIYNLNLPILGICYGFQLICKNFGGKVESTLTREFGRSNIYINKKSELIANIYKIGLPYKVWMSHSDSVVKLPKDFEIIAKSENLKISIAVNPKKKYMVYSFIQK